jgi:serine/threonine-protein phosphatase 2A activator
MIKMYNAEVLSKFPVVQHFPFGSLFSWEQDPNATSTAVSIHTTSHPMGHSTLAATGATRPLPQESTTASSANLNVGGVPVTAAPWSQASTVQPPKRAPWADGRGGKFQVEVARPAAIPPHSQIPDGPTRAPWANKGDS